MENYKLTSVKGMPDILPDHADKHKLPAISLWQLLETKLRNLMHSYNYQEIRFPILEHTNLFCRSLGDVTDIVEKEMYTFMDHDLSLSLRPEGTASCVRASIENGLLRNQQQQRLWYLGPMFRREQPQYGRYRQFYQFGVEVFGLTGPEIDAEQIAMFGDLWQQLGIADVTRLEVNTIGCATARAAFKKDLIAYFNEHYNLLDEDSKKRLTKNPLRILDSKNPALQELINTAPTLTKYLSAADQQHFDELLGHLTKLKIPYTINPRLIRGLDYYNRTVYEWVTGNLGAQAAVGAGGRYDSLSAQLGGPDTPGVGFALGLDRVLLLMQQQKVVTSAAPDGYLVCVGDLPRAAILELAQKIRASCPKFGLAINYGVGNFKNQFKKADQSGANLALIIGDNELANNTVTIKYLREVADQRTISFAELGQFLGGYCGRLSN